MSAIFGKKLHYTKIILEECIFELVKRKKKQMK